MNINCGARANMNEQERCTEDGTGRETLPGMQARWIQNWELYLRQSFYPQHRSDLIKIRLTPIYGNSHPPHFETGISWNYVGEAVLELRDAAST